MHKFFLSIVLTILLLPALWPQTVPGPTLQNFKTDLASIDTAGTRPVSGTLYNYMDVQGAVVLTGRKYDFAILGRGFFMVKSQTDGSILYTRCGRFFKAGNSFLTESGDEILLSKKDFTALCTTSHQVLQISLYYPYSGQSVHVLNNGYFTTSSECRCIDGNVIATSLEENPSDVKKLIPRIKKYLITNYNLPAESTCMISLEELETCLENTGTTENNSRVSVCTKKVLEEMDKLL